VPSFWVKVGANKGDAVGIFEIGSCVGQGSGRNEG
jgi:hypothetical protein